MLTNPVYNDPWLQGSLGSIAQYSVKIPFQKKFQKNSHQLKKSSTFLVLEFINPIIGLINCKCLNTELRIAHFWSSDIPTHCFRNIRTVLKQVEKSQACVATPKSAVLIPYSIRSEIVCVPVLSPVRQVEVPVQVLFTRDEILHRMAPLALFSYFTLHYAFDKSRNSH